MTQNGDFGQVGYFDVMVTPTYIQAPKWSVMHLNGLYNTYLVHTNHLGAFGGHLGPIHDPNPKLTQMTQNHHFGQVNIDDVYDV